MVDAKAIVPSVQPELHKHMDKERPKHKFEMQLNPNDTNEKGKQMVFVCSGAENEDVEAFFHALEEFKEVMQDLSHWVDTDTQGTDCTMLCKCFSMALDGSAKEDWFEIVNAQGQGCTWKAWKIHIPEFILTKACMMPDACCCQKKHLEEQSMPRGMDMNTCCK